MRRDLRRVVIERLAEHEEARVFGANARGELLPEGIRHPRDGVDAEGVGALVDPLFVGTRKIIEHGGIGRIEIRQLRQVAVEDRALLAIHRAGGVVEALQRVVRGI